MSKIDTCSNFINGFGNILSSMKNTIDNGRELKKVTHDIINNSNFEINENDIKLKCNMRIILSILKENCNIKEKEDNCNKNNYLMTAACVLFPMYAAIGFVGYKGYTAIKNNKEKTNETKRNQERCVTFRYLYNELGIEEKMNDVLYRPTIDELIVLKNEFELRTGSDIINFLENIVNK